MSLETITVKKEMPLSHGLDSRQDHKIDQGSTILMLHLAPTRGKTHCHKPCSPIAVVMDMKAIPAYEMPKHQRPCQELMTYGFTPCQPGTLSDNV